MEYGCQEFRREPYSRKGYEEQQMIRFENVTKVYPGQARPALDSVNLEITE